MKTTFLLAGLVVLAALWLIEKNSAAQLTVQIETQREAQREGAKLQREHERLRALQPSDAELQRLRRNTAAAANTPVEIRPAGQETLRDESPTALTLDEWTPAHAWQNRGTASPCAVIETALWAAAGGDVAAFKGLLTFADPTRAKTEALLARLPEGSRSNYASPEDLIAMFAIKNIPVGEAQLLWSTENGPDDAAVSVWLKNPSSDAGSVHRPANNGARYLSLHRDGASWRLIVPPSAVDKIARELSLTIRP